MRSSTCSNLEPLEHPHTHTHTHTHTPTPTHHPPTHPPTHTHTIALIKDNQTGSSTKAFSNVEKKKKHTILLGDIPLRNIPLGNIRLRGIRLGGIRLGDVRLRDGEGQDEWHRRISPGWKDMKTEGPSVSAFRLRGIRLCLSSLPSVSCNSTQVNIR